MTVEWWLQLVVLVLLGATLFHAVRLERALGALRRDRTQLEALLAGLDHSTQEAQAGLERLRGMVDGAGRDIARQAGLAGALRDDLGFLVDRGERLAARLDELVRAGRGLEAAGGAPAAPARAQPAAPVPIPAPVSAPVPTPAAAAPPAFAQPAPEQTLPPAPAPAFNPPAPPVRTAQPVLEAMIQHARQSAAQATVQPVVPPAALPAASHPSQAPQPEPSEARPVLRSQAERDLLLALRGAA